MMDHPSINSVGESVISSQEDLSSSVKDSVVVSPGSVSVSSVSSVSGSVSGSVSVSSPGGMSPSPGSAPQSSQQVSSLSPSGVSGISGVNGSVSGGGGGRVNYSIPGVLHFIQHEWSRFEMERSQWEEERAELQTRVAFLQGERKGQENLKKDLVRRIKMLEYALKQERNKYARLKKSSQLNAPNADEDLDECGGSKLSLEEGGLLEGSGEGDESHHDLLSSKLDGQDNNYVAMSNVNWRQGKQVLRQYLQEIGYTDTIIDVRANRVRSVLGLDVNRIHNGPPPPTNANTNNNASRQQPVNSATTHMNPEKEESVVMANFDFLSQEADAEEDENEHIPEESNNKIESELSHEERRKTGETYDASVDNRKWSTGSSANTYSRFTGARPGLSSASPSSQASESLKNPDRKLVGSNLELGELEQLAVINDNESSYDLTTPKEALRKTWSAKYTLRSHYDGVRALRFHPKEPVLITASEDQTLKMWNLQKTMPVKKSTAFDVEPVYTFRAHRGPVLSLDVSRAGDFIFSGGLDASIRVWNMPSPDIDPYDLYDSSVLASSLLGHTDAVWGVAYNNIKQQLLSCSADGTVKLWSPSSKVPLLRTFGSENNGTPTSVDWIHQEPSCMITAYSNAACIICDVETGKPVIKLDTQGNDVGAITRVACHPTLPMTVTAHDDRHIRFFDNYTGKLTHSMVAHLEAVTSIAIDVNGLYLISGSHDRSVRLWNLETKTCVQEITAHRKKFDESIFDVAFHPSSSYIASAGADALAKVFV